MSCQWSNFLDSGEAESRLSIPFLTTESRLPLELYFLSWPPCVVTFSCWGDCVPQWHG